MGKRQKAWARMTRDTIFTILGRKCTVCGSVENLEFDVLIPTGDNKHHRIMDWSHRMSFYRAQLAINNLGVKCDKCNGKKQDQMELMTQEPPDCPF